MAWLQVGTIESESEPGLVYQIKKAGTGRLGCSCPKYQWAKKGDKTCKHLKAYLAGTQIGQSVALPVGAKVIDDSVRVSSGGETFVIRRAIAFGEVR